MKTMTAITAELATTQFGLWVTSSTGRVYSSDPPSQFLITCTIFYASFRTLAGRRALHL